MFLQTLQCISFSNNLYNCIGRTIRKFGKLRQFPDSLSLLGRSRLTENAHSQAIRDSFLN